MVSGGKKIIFSTVSGLYREDCATSLDQTKKKQSTSPEGDLNEKY